ncbi:trypsin-like peptidase domain-containing protein [Candidatus Bathyarchaeota archaeon]|jgi:S1-C subfamily serine protease|nr:trypsin-like peptidase domain-containing protein [Candidatus Bathyarchaeota archaeon]
MSRDEQVIAAIEKVEPSVVNISTIRFERDAFLHVHPARGLGSGFIFDKLGHILTNHHITAGSREIEVALTDGRAFEGRLVGSDPANDLAVAKIDATDLPVAEMGDSNELKVGQTVIAIGNPFGLVGGPSVTVGVVSALNRHILAERVYEKLIQTDASINPGNSGGPLLDLTGKVVGINTANIPGAQSIGFAIPINTAKTVLEDIVKHGRVTRPWLGIIGIDISRELARRFNLTVDTGVMVMRVIPESPAERADLQSGDVVAAVGDAHVASMEDLQREIRTRTAGDAVSLVVVRGSDEGRVRVTI